MKERLAIVGSGVSGVVSAFLLHDRFNITIFEADHRIGGHTNTIVLPAGPDEGVGIDTGFIVLNNKNYPLFTQFLSKLGVSTRWSDMSFGFYSAASQFCYAGTDLGGMFADRLNLLRPSYYGFLFELARFCRDASKTLDGGSTSAESLGDFVRRQHYSARLIDSYIVPMTSAIWSCPRETALEYPAVSLFRFFRNHGLLSLWDRPRWQTVVGGSHSYLRAFEKVFRGEIYKGTPIRSIDRTAGLVSIVDAQGTVRQFDRVIIATHADQAIRLLADPTELESRLLGRWRYQKNQGYLHYDESILPPNRRGWASWNVREISSGNRDEKRLVTTYYMNLLQGIRSSRSYCVSFDCAGLVDQNKIIAELDYMHPIYDSESNSTQSELPLLNQQENRTFFVGSYFGYGFHEDAVGSANKLARAIGGVCLG